jgi:ATP-binding cassette subfamily B protein
VLNNINIEIEQNKVTAIVGTSGSGKTTLLKLLFGFYKPVGGSIKIGNTDLSEIDMQFWRSKCGAVLQDGFLFSDSIARNIAASQDDIDIQKLDKAVRIANIGEFIRNLPLGCNTIIGDKGNGLSQGQKQRILIARAVYKNPEFLFFDEATNALDADNEYTIMRNLEQFFKGRTVVVVAHRLSTVKNADNIVVMHKGEVIETGTHCDLVKQKGVYLNLVKNQLELAA